MKSQVAKRSIVVAGHKTSVSLEDAFWNGLKEIAGRRDITLSDLVAAIDSQPSKPENQRRRKVLKEMYRIPKRYVVTNQACRDLGDAIFALFAPADSTVLTTNLKDHLPLAQALGKTATEP